MKLRKSTWGEKTVPCLASVQEAAHTDFTFYLHNPPGDPARTMARLFSISWSGNLSVTDVPSPCSDLAYKEVFILYTPRTLYPRTDTQLLLPSLSSPFLSDHDQSMETALVD